MKFKLTASGIGCLLRSLDGGAGLVFSAVTLGDGRRELPMDIIGRVIRDGFLELICVMDNRSLTDGFRVNEISVYIDDPDRAGERIRFAMAETAPEKSLYIPASSEYVFEHMERIHVYIADADNVTVILADSSVWVTRDEFYSHTDDYTVHFTPELRRTHDDEHDAFRAHMRDSTIHVPISVINGILARLEQLENSRNPETTGNAFSYNLSSLNGLTVTRGIWDENGGWLEC